MNGDYIVVLATILNITAAVMYAVGGDVPDWPRVGYWSGAFIITGSTLFIGR